MQFEQEFQMITSEDVKFRSTCDGLIALSCVEAESRDFSFLTKTTPKNTDIKFNSGLNKRLSYSNHPR